MQEHAHSRYLTDVRLMDRCLLDQVRSATYCCDTCTCAATIKSSLLEETFRTSFIEESDEELHLKEYNPEETRARNENAEGESFIRAKYW